MDEFIFRPPNPEITPKRVRVVLDRCQVLLEKYDLDPDALVDISGVGTTLLLTVAEMSEEKCVKSIHEILNFIESDETEAKHRLLEHNGLRALLHRAREIQSTPRE